MNGVINVYKPKGITSFDVVRQVRKICKTKKIGHTGTLDPLACGVLPICIGKATKIVNYIMDDYKVYKTKLKLGIVTDTYDREGEVLATNPVNISENQLISCINSFKGNILQIPPMYSAIKVGGKRLYELARKGIEIDRKSRPITIFDIKILGIDLPYVSFLVKCSKGTYIRSLCYDIGTKLNCGGTMWDLERIQSGRFTKEKSVDLDKLAFDNLQSFLIPMDKVLDNYESIIVHPKLEKLLLNGVEVADRRLISDIEFNKLYRIYSINNQFLGIGLRSNKGLKITKLLL